MASTPPGKPKSSNPPPIPAEALRSGNTPKPSAEVSREDPTGLQLNIEVAGTERAAQEKFAKAVELVLKQDELDMLAKKLEEDEAVLRAHAERVNLEQKQANEKRSATVHVLVEARAQAREAEESRARAKVILLVGMDHQQKALEAESEAKQLLANATAMSASAEELRAQTKSLVQQLAEERTKSGIVVKTEYQIRHIHGGKFVDRLFSEMEISVKTPRISQVSGEGPGFANIHVSPVGNMIIKPMGDKTIWVNGESTAGAVIDQGSEFASDKDSSHKFQLVKVERVLPKQPKQRKLSPMNVSVIALFTASIFLGVATAFYIRTPHKAVQMQPAQQLVAASAPVPTPTLREVCEGQTEELAQKYFGQSAKELVFFPQRGFKTPYVRATKEATLRPSGLKSVAFFNLNTAPGVEICHWEL